MKKIIDKIISYSFGILIFLVPLVFSPKTSEIFEFNKMVTVYIFTAFISLLWIVKMIVEKRIIFRRTIIDIPIIIFVASQLISTLLSLDFRTSFLGYYSRFHGGLISYICYSILYWAFVSNISQNLIKIPLISLFTTTTLTSIWGILEHFGHSFSCLIVPEFHVFDVSCWIQDVQSRVYATFGQPNWMAAFLIAVIPITWAISINNYKFSIFNIKIKSFWIGHILSAIFFVALIYTKSRSGFLAFAVSDILFWGLGFLATIKIKANLTKILKSFAICHLLFLILISINGSPWTPPLKDYLSRQKNITQEVPATPPNKVAGPALEVGGTESGKIRNIVWKGAIDVWKHFPIFGSGVETFAFSYYQYRPLEHNLVSEWDYLYNKAHNEYLNFAATTGTVGIIAYLTLIGLIIYQISNLKFLITKEVPSPKSQKSDLSGEPEISFVRNSLLSGFISILITNFFGFSVVPVTLLFFLIPAASWILQKQNSDEFENKIQKINSTQIILISLSILIFSYFIVLITRYWRADNLYAKGIINNDAGNYALARNYLVKAIKLSTNEPVFWDELAKSTASIALLANKEEKNDLVNELLLNFNFESGKALNLSLANINIKRNQASLYIQLSTIKPEYLLTAKELLIESIKLAPTEAKLLYNLAIAYYRTGDIDSAINLMEKTVSYKANYKDAYFALSLMYLDKEDNEKAKENLEYILKYLDPGNEQIKRQLDEIK